MGVSPSTFMDAIINQVPRQKKCHGQCNECSKARNCNDFEKQRLPGPAAGLEPLAK